MSYTISATNILRQKLFAQPSTINSIKIIRTAVEFTEE